MTTNQGRMKKLNRPSRCFPARRWHACRRSSIPPLHVQEKEPLLLALNAFLNTL